MILNSAQITLVTTAEKHDWEFTNEETKEFRISTVDFDDQAVFMLHEDKLAVALFCMKPVYEFCNKLLKELTLTAEWWKNSENHKEILNVTQALVIISGYHHSAWNCRRRILLENPSRLSKELNFVDICLSKHPKSSDTWAYR